MDPGLTLRPGRLGPGYRISRNCQHRDTVRRSSTIPALFHSPSNPNSPQNLSVLLDTASADLWVVSSRCTTCAAATPKFDHARSSTFQFANGAQDPYVNLTYPAGSVLGSTAQDSVSMGGLTVASQTLCEPLIHPIMLSCHSSLHPP
jgi:hypothetical protein